MELPKERTIKNINTGIYNDQIKSLEDLRSSSRRPVPSRAELIREALDEYIERCLQPEFVGVPIPKASVVQGKA